MKIFQRNFSEYSSRTILKIVLQYILRLDYVTETAKGSERPCSQEMTTGFRVMLPSTWLHGWVWAEGPHLHELVVLGGVEIILEVPLLKAQSLVACDLPQLLQFGQNLLPLQVLQLLKFLLLFCLLLR